MNFTYMMLKMLTSAYNRSDVKKVEKGEQPQTNIGKVLSIGGWGFDIINSHAEKVILWDNIDYAEGKVLDKYGENYGVYRGKAPDDIYRVMIKVKVMAMLSAGNLDTLINATTILFDVKNNRVEACEIFPAKIYLFVEEEDLDEIHKLLSDTISLLMRRIKAAGIGMRIFRRTYYHALEAIYIGSLTEKFTKKTLEPLVEDKKITYNTPLNLGIGTIIYVKKSFMPSVYVLSDTNEKIEVTTKGGAKVYVG